MATVDALLKQLGDRLALQIAEALRPIIRSEVAAAMADRTEVLQPLAAILGISPDAARARINRDPELARLAVRIGRRSLFRRSDVEALVVKRNRKPVILSRVE